jgi:hypothetical protein
VYKIHIRNLLNICVIYTHIFIYIF